MATTEVSNIRWSSIEYGIFHMFGMFEGIYLIYIAAKNSIGVFLIIFFIFYMFEEWLPR